MGKGRLCSQGLERSVFSVGSRVDGWFPVGAAIQNLRANDAITLIRDGQRVTKFACVDGPDFNGYEIDFDEAMRRGRMYADFERHAYEKTCSLMQRA